MEKCKKCGCQTQNPNVPDVDFGMKFGKKLSEINDVEWLRSAVDKLWQLLDDIDTANDSYYRKIARARMINRHEILISDGFDLFLPLDSQ